MNRWQQSIAKIKLILLIFISSTDFASRKRQQVKQLFMTKIGLLSDTHGWLDPAVAIHFKDCDEIWHAGDFGNDSISKSLQLVKPLRIFNSSPMYFVKYISTL